MPERLEPTSLHRPSSQWGQTLSEQRGKQQQAKTTGTIIWPRVITPGVTGRGVAPCWHPLKLKNLNFAQQQTQRQLLTVGKHLHCEEAAIAYVKLLDICFYSIKGWELFLEVLSLHCPWSLRAPIFIVTGKIKFVYLLWKHFVSAFLWDFNSSI